ncbi:GntR family transcriptional regulator [Clostridium vincentii]|uniref:HTH-type transcriptional repressor YtrA n=1 Tax=Clostridium vincentii TaxID=52704 RepID=A0A2T0BB04_9CLOT|nr:GntR family transcriptional regulator [Clostridium vincentii]PRR81086.1 HTH-type transcriptional repressor YtrA [Clostridium vincentii]
MIQVDSKSSIPLYEQIHCKVKELILKNALREGDKLPSVRELAFMITINPNTISKAYGKLEEDGIIETFKGKGTFIKSEAKSLVKKYGIFLIEKDLRKILENALLLNLELRDIIKMEKKIYADVEEKNNDRN